MSNNGRSRFSRRIAHKYSKENKRFDWQDEVELMIDMLHKKTKYLEKHEGVVEIFRRADWIDLTKCRKSFGLSKIKYDEIIEEFPVLDLHRFLINQTFKNFFKSPLNPLPMFKR